MTRLSLAIALALFGCSDDRPSRPDEAKFRAAEPGEQCRMTAARAIQCTDAIIVSDVQAIGIPELAEEVEKDLAKDAPATPSKKDKDQRANIEVHKHSCLANKRYAVGVFECWAIEDCKKFAACVSEKSR